MTQEFSANAEEIYFGAYPTDLVQKLSVRINAEAEIVHVFLHPLHLGQFPDIGGANRLIQSVDIIEHLEPDGSIKGFPSLLLPELMKDPWIPNRPPANHQTAGASVR